MDPSAEAQARAARTQSMFRDVNERVREINDTFSFFIPLSEWICECADPVCSERVALTPEEYENVRGDPRRFVVAPGEEHFFPEIEDLAERTDRYWVVEKYGIAGELAAKLDPRGVGLRGKERASSSAIAR